MTDKLVSLDSFDLVACEGVDAEVFLQSQLSNDVRLLAETNGQWTALISPQGRVQSVMLLARQSADRFVLAVPHRRGAAVVDYLRRFLLRRKAKLAVDPAVRLLASNQEQSINGAQRLQMTMPDGRCVYLADASVAANPATITWQLADLRAGVPWLPEAAVDRHLAHALQLDCLPAISLKKGCYPGQEIVARTHYLGRSKRFLGLMSADGNDAAVVAGASVRDDNDRLIGEIVDAATLNGETLALAVMSAEPSGLMRIVTADRAPIELRWLQRF